MDRPNIDLGYEIIVIMNIINGIVQAFLKTGRSAEDVKSHTEIIVYDDKCITVQC